MRKRATAAALILALLPLIGCTLLPSTVRAATITAASCSRNDVGTAVNSAANGDTVVIPPGDCIWATNLKISSKYLTLQGAGIDKTIIRDGVSKATYPNIPQVLVWNTIDGGITRLTGVTFQGGTLADNYNKGMLEINGSSHRFRIDNCKFIPTKTSAIFLYGDFWGVIDHNIFDLSARNGFGLYVMGVPPGDISWSKGSTLGTEENVFLEDNVFTQDGSNGFFYPAMDGWNGHRVVVRYNKLNNVKLANHGTESGGRYRSARQFEYYNNSWTWNMQGSSYPSAIAIRGGTGVIYNNTASVVNGTLKSFVDYQYYRAGSSYSPWGQCPSVWDLNATRCLDQTGVGQGILLSSFSNPSPVGWPNQVSDPAYDWNNFVNGKVSNAVSNVPSVVQENRDFFHSAKPGYTPFVYPHPLTTGSSASGIKPDAPQNLTVSAP